MGERKERFCGQDFDGGSIKVKTGGYQLDLTDASMKGDEAVLAVDVSVGEVKLRVPATWRTRVEGDPSLGSITDRTRQPRGDVDAPLLRIVADVVLAELKISN